MIIKIGLADGSFMCHHNISSIYTHGDIDAQ